MDIQEELQASADYLRERGVGKVDVAIVLGTGLGGLVNEIDEELTFNYSQIPHIPVATVEFHFGKLIYGALGRKRVLAWQGRFHYYEGYTMEQVVKPVRISKMLGAKALLISNAAGSLNPDIKKGALMCIEDHINLFPDSPLRGRNLDALGGRFPDMCEPYDQKLVDVALQVARREDIVAHKGVFVAVAGPNLETRAEYRFLRTIGADVVGMSTVPEVIVAAHAGLRVVGFSIITDMCLADALKPAVVEEIIAIANAAEPQLTKLVMGVLQSESQTA